jgi:hypothetical protein
MYDIFWVKRSEKVYVLPPSCASLLLAGESSISLSVWVERFFGLNDLFGWNGFFGLKSLAACRDSLCWDPALAGS